MRNSQAVFALCVVCIIFSLSNAVSTGSHSLLAFVTFINGKTPFPELSMVLLLDDVQVAYYDSVERRLINRRYSPTKAHDEEELNVNTVVDEWYSSMKNRGLSLMKKYNNTQGIHLYQRITGCDLLENGDPGLMQTWDAWDGKDIEGFLYDVQQNSFQSKVEWFDRSSSSVNFVKNMYLSTFHPICMKTLMRYLHMEKNNVTRRVKPRVRVLRKTLPDSGGVQLSCLATGFYPRHINLTLFRDGQPVAEDQITGGMLRPNGDGTYQMRKSLEISAEELREKHSYTCTATHLSLDNKLDITFDADPVPRDCVWCIVCAAAAAVVFVILTIVGCCKWRRAGSEKRHCTKYAFAPSTDESEDSFSAISFIDQVSLESRTSHNQ